MAHYETERKFLVVGEFKSQSYNATRIQQGYIASNNGRTVRVRIRGDKGYLTIKGPSGLKGITRYEFDTEIPLDDARELMEICEPGIIDKTRYLVKSPDGRHTWEIDEFYGDNEGLVLPRWNCLMSRRSSRNRNLSAGKSRAIGASTTVICAVIPLSYGKRKFWK